MNQFVHLFSIDVDKKKRKKPTTDNPVEMLSTVKWLSREEIIHLNDWKVK